MVTAKAIIEFVAKMFLLNIIMVTTNVHDVWKVTNKCDLNRIS